MAKKPKVYALVIEYNQLGTISLEELAHALIEDLRAIQEDFNVRYCTNVRIRIPITNEYGDTLRVFRETGAPVFKIDTYHYRPSCLDYDL